MNGSRSSIRSWTAERATASSSRASAVAQSRAVWANIESGSRRASRSSPISWRRVLRRAGSTVGPISTSGPSDPGEVTASCVTTWQPSEFATTSGRRSPACSSQPPSECAISEMPQGPVGDPLRPWPGRSGTNTENTGASAEAKGTM